MCNFGAFVDLRQEKRRKMGGISGGNAPDTVADSAFRIRKEEKGGKRADGEGALARIHIHYI